MVNLGDFGVFSKSINQIGNWQCITSDNTLSINAPVRETCSTLAPNRANTLAIESPQGNRATTPPAMRRLSGLWLVGAARCSSPRTSTATMPKLTDTQCVLLSTAAKRNSLSLYPLPTSLKLGGGLQKALAALTLHGLVKERETSDAASVSRSDGDYRYGLFATAAGLAAIGVEPEDMTAETPAPIVLPAAAPTNKTPAVLDLLRRTAGATLADLIGATDWLPHTTRAALTGLRKKDHAIERGKRGDETCYFLRAA